MMMQMLEAGGMKILTDNIRKSDKDNPKGYYEFEKVKQIKNDQSWLENARGKAAKIISFLLKYLPEKHQYKIIFMERRMEEILISQKQMIINQKKSNKIDDQQMMKSFYRHLEQIKKWLKKQTNIEVLFLNYNQILKNPVKEIKKINQFLNHNLKAEKMVKTINPRLYRQKAC